MGEPYTPEEIATLDPYGHWDLADIERAVATIRALVRRADAAPDLTGLWAALDAARKLIVDLAWTHENHTGALPHIAVGPEVTPEMVALYESAIRDDAARDELLELADGFPHAGNTTDEPTEDRHCWHCAGKGCVGCEQWDDTTDEPTGDNQ